jgi:PEP-CTERM motif
MNPKSNWAPLAGACFALLSTTAAQATTTVYTTQASFLAAISAVGVDTFNDLNPAATLSTPQNRTAGPYTYRASVGPVSNFFPGGTAGGDVWLSVNNLADTITFDNFAAGVRGVGGFFFGSNLAGQFDGTPATVNVSATDASGTVTQGLVNPLTTTFLGFVSNGALSNVKVFVGTAGTGVPGVWPTVNNLTLGAAVTVVPEPQTYALMLMGLAMLGVAARRSRG